MAALSFQVKYYPCKSGLKVAFTWRFCVRCAPLQFHPPPRALPGLIDLLLRHNPSERIHWNIHSTNCTKENPQVTTGVNFVCLGLNNVRQET